MSESSLSVLLVKGVEPIKTGQIHTERVWPNIASPVYAAKYMQYMYTSQQATYCGNLQRMVLVLGKAQGQWVRQQLTYYTRYNIYVLKLSHILIVHDNTASVSHRKFAKRSFL